MVLDWHETFDVNESSPDPAEISNLLRDIQSRPVPEVLSLGRHLAFGDDSCVRRLVKHFGRAFGPRQGKLNSYNNQSLTFITVICTMTNVLLNLSEQSNHFECTYTGLCSIYFR